MNPCRSLLFLIFWLVGLPNLCLKECCGNAEILFHISQRCNDRIQRDETNSFSTKQDDRNHSSCQMHENFKMHRILGIREQLMALLNIESQQNFPVVTVELKRRIRDVLKISDHFSSTAFRPKIQVGRGEKFASQNGPWKLRQSGARMTAKVIFGQTDLPETNHPADLKRTYFKLHNMTDRSIRNATLYFSVRRPCGIHADSAADFFEFNIHLYRFMNPTSISTTPLVSRTYKLKKSNRIMDTSEDDEAENFSIELNLTDLIREWIRVPKKYYGLMIRASHKNEDLVDRITDANNQSSKIWLNVEFQTDSRHATSLEVPDEPVCALGQNESRCCRYHLQVDFESMGWDWVVTPKRYDAYYCAGSCPFRHQQNTAHAHIIQQQGASAHALLRNGSALTKSGGGPCCAPVAYRPLELIYVSQAGTVHKRLFDNMMVTKCVCV